jgi:xanthine dehydrogenase accessory factor
VLREVLEELTTALEAGRECVYCSVVETRGSTPQKPGASMLVFPDGRQVGTLGGGCVEAEVRQRAMHAIGVGKPEIHTFCLDDNYGWDDGLICGGRMTILADPFTNTRNKASTYYQRYRDLIARGVGCTEAIAISETTPALPPGQRYLFDAEGRLLDAMGSAAAPPASLIDALTPLSKRPRPAAHHGIAFLPSLPRITLLIVGGGHVAQAVARLAADVDFATWVVDDREHYASRERFPSAERLMVGDIGPTLTQLVPEITTSHYCLIVTRGHAHDEEALYHLAGCPAGYIGMIGSKRKIKLIYEDLIAKGISADALKRVHAPLGFNIGSQTVSEIAVSIVAELIACRNLGQTIAAARIQVPVEGNGTCASP